MPLPHVNPSILSHLSRAERTEALNKRRANQPAEKPEEVAHYYFSYCIVCGHPADHCYGTDTRTLAKFCPECQALKDIGWLDQ